MGKKSTLSKSTPFNPLFLPVIFILTVVPLFVRMMMVNVDDATAQKIGASLQSELFAQYKAIALLIGGVALLVFGGIFYKKLFAKRDKLTLIYLCAAGVFLLFTLLSSIFSEHKQIAFFGYFNNAQGFFSIACYVAIFVYTLYAYQKTSDFRYIMMPLLVVVVINALWGTFEYAGINVLSTEFGQNLMVSPTYRETYDLTFNALFASGKVSGTLYHYNYVGSFAAMTIPLTLIAALFEKDLKHRIILASGTLLSIWLLFGSSSRAGLIGMAGVVLFGILLFAKILLKHWKILLIAAGTVAVFAIGLNFVTKGAIFERIPSLVEDSLGLFINQSDFDYKDELPIRDVKENGPSIELSTQNDLLKITAQDDTLLFTDKAGNEVSFVSNGTSFTAPSGPFEGFSFSPYRKSEASVSMDCFDISYQSGLTLRFNVDKDSSIHLSNPVTGENMVLQEAAHFGFAGKERLGSSRGYIWSRTFPLLKDCLLLGYGPDTFVFQFPQEELLTKYWAYGDTTTVIDKPHNLYLQTFCSGGGIAFLAFLVIILTYIFDSGRLYFFKKTYTKDHALGIAAFLAIIGYLFAGFFNDSIVAVAPVFWAILGAGAAINYHNRKALKAEGK